MKKIFTLNTALFLSIFTFAQLTTEQKKIKQTFFDFLHHYKKNIKKYNSFDFYKSGSANDGPPYKINWKEAEKYFAFLKTNVPYIGQAYIKAERDHFRFYDSCYKADSKEEIVVGFDFDRWAGCQDDADYCIKWHTSAKNKYEVKITGNKAVLRIGSELYEGATEKDRSWYFVPFVKEKGKWVMADNIYPEDDDESE